MRDREDYEGRYRSGEYGDEPRGRRSGGREGEWDRGQGRQREDAWVLQRRPPDAQEQEWGREGYGRGYPEGGYGQELGRAESAGGPGYGPMPSRRDYGAADDTRMEGRQSAGRQDRGWERGAREPRGFREEVEQTFRRGSGREGGGREDDVPPGERMMRPDLMRQSTHSDAGFERGGGRGPLGGGYWGQGGTMARGPYTGRGPKGYQRADERIREDVCEALAQHGDIDASEIEILVQNGEVTLTGTVEDRYQKRLAEDVVESAPACATCTTRSASRAPRGA